MKFITTALLLVPTIALAVPPQKSPHTFAQMKESMLPSMAESLPYMKESRTCVSKSSNSEQLNNCAEIMMEFRNKMMGSAPGNPGQQPPKTPQMEWSPELKEQILTNIDASIKNTTAALGCLEASSNNEQMVNCMEKAGFKRPQPAQRR
ncbi:MAG: hypothetical protein ABW149_15135 [Sedimenticola sp.]